MWVDPAIVGVGSVAELVFCRRAGYKQSLQVLKHAKESKEGLYTKTSIMLGLGETHDEVVQVLILTSDAVRGPIYSVWRNFDLVTAVADYERPEGSWSRRPHAWAVLASIGQASGSDGVCHAGEV